MNRFPFLRFLPRVVPMLFVPAILNAQTAGAPDKSQPLDAPRRSEAVYPVPYAPMSVSEITAVPDRVRTYLESCTPPRLVERESGAEITDYPAPNPTRHLRGDFLLVSYSGLQFGPDGPTIQRVKLYRYQ